MTVVKLVDAKNEDKQLCIVEATQSCSLTEDATNLPIKHTSLTESKIERENNVKMKQPAKTSSPHTPVQEPKSPFSMFLDKSYTTPNLVFDGKNTLLITATSKSYVKLLIIGQFKIRLYEFHQNT